MQTFLKTNRLKGKPKRDLLIYPKERNWLEKKQDFRWLEIIKIFSAAISNVINEMVAVLWIEI